MKSESNIFVKYPQMRIKGDNGVIYVCKCGEQFVKSKERFLNHVSRCSIFRAFDLEQSTNLSGVYSYYSEGQSVEYIRRRQDHNSSQNIDESIYDTRIKSLEQSVMDLSTRILRLGPQESSILDRQNQAQFYANKLLQSTIGTIQQIIKTGLTSLFRQLIESKTKITTVFDSIKRGLISQLNGINYLSLIDKYPEMLQKFHELIIKEKSKNEPRTVQKYQRGYKFWKKFRSLADYGLIIQQLKLLTKNGRYEALLYYNCMKANFQYPCPIIPSGILEKRKYLKKKPLNLDDIRSGIKLLLENKQVVRAVDFWFVTCLGLRKRQLKKVYLQSSVSKDFFDCIVIFQFKNKNWVTRIIPQSLKQLVNKYNISYPITEERLQKLVEMSKKLNRRFYGYRSSCITGLVTAFAASNLRTHRSAQTTANYYVNDQNAFFINTVFNLDFLNEPEIKPSNMVLKQDQQHSFNEVSIKSNQFIISLQQIFNQDQDQQMQQAAVSKMEEIQQNQITQIERRQIEICQKLFQVCSVQFESTHFQSIEDAIQFTLEDRKFIQCFKKKMEESRSTKSQNKVIKVQKLMTELYDIQLIYFEISIGQGNSWAQQMEKIDWSHKQRRSFVVVIHVWDKEFSYFRVSDHAVVWSSTYARRQLLQQTQMIIEEQFYPFSIKMKCPQCRQELYSSEDRQYQMLVCSNNHVAHHRKPSVIEALKQRSQGILFQTNDVQQFERSFQPCKFAKETNNFEQTILKQLRTYVHQYEYFSFCPKRLRTTISPYNQQTANIIRQNSKNEKYLPLRIANSGERGLGIYAMEQIPKNTLLMSYIGQIGTNQNAFICDDSIFNLGKFRDNQGVKDLIIIGRQKTNAARYVNSPSNPNQANTRAEVCWIPTNSQNNIGLYEIRIIYVTKRKIQKGQQLQVFYNPYLWSEQFKQKCRLKKNYMSKVYGGYRPQYKNAAIIIIDQIFQSYPEQFKSRLQNKVAHQRKYEQYLQPIIQDIQCQQNEERISLDYSVMRRLDPNMQKSIKQFLKQHTGKVYIGQSQKLAILVENYPNEDIKQNLQILSRSFNYFRPVLGDGSCFYRCIAFYYLKLQDYKQFELLFINCSPHHQLNSQINIIIQQIFAIMQNKIGYLYGRPDFIKQLLQFWNKTSSFDTLICIKIRQLIVQQILQNYGLYYQFVSDIDKICEQINNIKQDVPDIAIKAAAFALKLRIQVHSISEEGVSVSRFGKQSWPIATIFLRAQHYQICQSVDQQKQQDRKKEKRKTKKIVKSQN